MNERPTAQPPAAPQPDNGSQSLFGRISALASQRGRRRGFTAALGGILLVVAFVEGIVWFEIGHVRREATAAGEGAARAAEAHDRLTAFAAAVAQAPLDADLQRIRAHLPPDARLAEAARDESGILTLAIDSADPDILRDSLANDPVLNRLSERGQERRDDGTIRVRLSGTIG